MYIVDNTMHLFHSIFLKYDDQGHFSMIYYVIHLVHQILHYYQHQTIVRYTLCMGYYTPKDSYTNRPYRIYLNVLHFT